MKHKLKRIFNSSTLSRALITVITCSIIFSYAVLCPQADSSTFAISVDINSAIDIYIDSYGDTNVHFTTYPLSPGFPSTVGTELTPDDIGYVPDGYIVYKMFEDAPSSADRHWSSVELSYYIPTIDADYSTLKVDFVLSVPRFSSNDSYNTVGAGLWRDETFTDGESLGSFSFSSVTGPFYDLVTSVEFYNYNFSAVFDLTGIDLSKYPIFCFWFYFDCYHYDVPGQLVVCPYQNLKFTYTPYPVSVILPGYLDNITSSLENTNSTLVSIENTLTNVSPEMQESIDNLENLVVTEQEKIDDVITEMDNIDTDFGTEIGDFDNILNENAGTLEDIGSTTYNSFINDVFGNWFFVSMFALFGAFAFFSRAVFG